MRGEMRLQSYRIPERKLAKGSFLFGSFLLLMVAICAAGFLHQAFAYLQRLESRFENKEPSLKLEHVVHRRSLEEEAPVPTFTGAVGTTYVRWGRRNCPEKEGTSIVYRGYAGGQYHAHTGGGSNFLCLHENVSYTPGHYVSGAQGPAYIYGVEYRDGPNRYSLFDLSLIEQGVLQYQGVPCTVCLVRSPTQLMIPSRETCPKGWNKEYTGYIMANSHGEKQNSQYICVDDQPQAVPSTEGNQNGGFLFVVEADCPYNLPCEPYVDGWEIRCVVCSLK